MARRLNILQVANGFPPTAIGGTESHTYALARELARAHSVSVVCREADLARPDYSVISGSVDGLPVRRIVNNLLDVAAFEHLYRNRRIEQWFARALDDIRPDLIHFQHTIGLSAGCIELADRRRIPFVVSLHDYWYICPAVNLLRPDRAACPGTHHNPNCFDCVRLVPGKLQGLLALPGYRALHRMVPSAIRQRTLSLVSRSAHAQPGAPVVRERAEYMRQLLSRSPALIVPSQYVKRKYVDFGIPSDHFRVIPLGMDLARWAGLSHTRIVPPAPNSEDPLRFVYVGGLSPQKGLDILVRAMSQIAGPLALDIYGFEPPGQLFTARVRALGSADKRIRFRGPIANEALPQVLSQVDALLMPALWDETFSFVIREALLAGLPVIAARKGVIAELVQDGENGRLLPAGDVAAWAGCLREFVEHPSLLAALRPRPGRLALLSTEENAEQQLAVYDEVLAAAD